MAAEDEIYAALRKALTDDSETYNLGNTMNGQPYGYNTPCLMEGFLKKVSDALADAVPPIAFDPETLDSTACMTVTLQNLAVQIMNNI
jgi:hypothetical protein